MIAIKNDLIPLLEIYCYITPFYKRFLRTSIKLATAGPSTATIEFTANQHFSYSSVAMYIIYHYSYFTSNEVTYTKIILINFFVSIYITIIDEVVEYIKI